jgi:hypothetical protein
MWKLVERFISPYRTMFFNSKLSESSVDWRLRDLYDSTAIFANQNLAASLDSSLTNSAIQWFHYTFKQPEAMNYIEVLQWLEACNRIAYQTLQESNFSLEANELYLDLTSFGVGGMGQEVIEKPNGSMDTFDFKTIPLDEFYFDQDHRGMVLNFYRKFYWTAQQLLTKFGRDDIPIKIYDQAISGNKSNERYEVIYAIYKREGMEFDSVNTFNILEPDSRPYGFKYFLVNSLEDLGEEGGFYEMPVYIPRWRKATGSVWGWSPSMTAIYDVLSLNQLVGMVFSAGEKAIDPSIMTTKRGVFGNIDLTAAGVTIVSDMKAMQAFESKARFDVSSLSKSELQQAIDRAYFMDQLQLKESPAMTATEVNARIQLMQRLLGPTYGRLQFDFLDQLLDRTFKILYRYKKLPPVPQIVQENGWELDIDYLGPLAKAQRYGDAQAIERVLGTATAMNETFPGITDNINSDEAIRELGEVSGAPAKIWNSKAEVEKTRKTRAAEMAQQKELAQAQQAGDAGQSLGKAGQELKLMQGGQAEEGEQAA